MAIWNAISPLLIVGGSCAQRSPLGNGNGMGKQHLANRRRSSAEMMKTALRAGENRC